MIYRINEIFLSRQGEGFNQGKEVVFIRLAGCNLSCPWCDTEYHSFTEYSVDQVIKEISQFDCNAALITGGEPAVQNLTFLLEALKDKNYWTGIETNGTISLTRYNGLIDYITVSPKKQVKQFKANELRIVNDHREVSELLSLENEIMADRYYLSPLEINGEMNIMDTMIMVDALNQQGNKPWHISLQLHKLIGIR